VVIIKLRITIGQLSNFTKYAHTPRNIDTPNTHNIIDLISMLDEEYFENISKENNPLKDHSMDLLDPKLKSLLHLLWNPITQEFYEDVSVEARTAPPESNNIPIEQNPFLKLPADSWYVLVPDAGC
jgi:hypothetical protein